MIILKSISICILTVYIIGFSSCILYDKFKLGVKPLFKHILSVHIAIAILIILLTKVEYGFIYFVGVGMAYLAPDTFVG